MGRPAGELNQLRGSEQISGQDLEFGMFTCLKCRVIRGVQCGMCKKRFCIACRAMRKGVRELQCQCDKLRWVWLSCKTLVRNTRPENTQIGQRQTFRLVNNKGIASVNENDSNGLPKRRGIQE